MKQAPFLLLLVIAFLSPTFAQGAEVRLLHQFTKVHYEGHGSLFLEHSDQSSIKIQTGQDALLHNVKTEIRDETLYIWYEISDTKDYTTAQPRVDVYLSYQQLEAITVYGRVRVDVNEPIKTDRLDIHAEGYIDLDLQMEVDHLDTYAEGSVQMALSGSTNSQSIVLEGLGSVNAFELSSNDSKAQVDGFGSIYLSAREALEAVATGLSKIIYTGNPAKKVFNRTGNVSIKSREI